MKQKLHKSKKTKSKPKKELFRAPYDEIEKLIGPDTYEPEPAAAHRGQFCG